MNLQWIPDVDDKGSAVLEAPEKDFKVTFEGRSAQIMPILELVADYLENQPEETGAKVPHLAFSKPRSLFE